MACDFLYNFLKLFDFSSLCISRALREFHLNFNPGVIVGHLTSGQKNFKTAKNVPINIAGMYRGYSFKGKLAI